MTHQPVAPRYLARLLGEQFKTLATNPTLEHQRLAQQLYTDNFCTLPFIGAHHTEDFNVGDMNCIEALVTLDVHRHRDDPYLAAYSEIKVIPPPRGGARPGAGAPKGNQNARKTEHKATALFFGQRMEPEQKAAIERYLEEHGLTQKELLIQAFRAFGVDGV